MTLQFYFLLQNPLKPCFLLLRPYFLPLPQLISTSCLLYHSRTLDLLCLLCPTFPSSYSFSFFLTFLPKTLTSYLLYIFSFSLCFASPHPVSCPPWPNSWPLYPLPVHCRRYYPWDPPDLPPSPCLSLPFCSLHGSVHPSHSLPNRCRPTFK